MSAIVCVEELVMFRVNRLAPPGVHKTYHGLLFSFKGRWGYAEVKARRGEPRSEDYAAVVAGHLLLAACHLVESGT